MAKQRISTGAERAVARPAPDVWAVLRRFGDLSWAVGQGVSSFHATGDGVGMLRTATAPHDGGRIVERLTARDEEGMSISYVIVEGALPSLTDYQADAEVHPREGGCAVTWRCSALPEAGAEASGQQILDGMAGRMATLFVAQFED